MNKIESELEYVLLSSSQEATVLETIFYLFLHIYSFLLINQNSRDQGTFKREKSTELPILIC